MNSDWTAPVCAASAVNGKRVESVVEAPHRHCEWLIASGLEHWLRRRAEGRLRTYLDLISEDARRKALLDLEADSGRLRQEILEGLNPYEAVSRTS